jgi:hypothetical protein
VQLSCQGFDEISGGGTFELDCVATSDNGASVQVTAQQGNANISVSPAEQNCSSGTACSFMVTGHNDGSTVLTSSVLVVAQANGAQATWDGSFKVNPGNNGF